MKAVEHIYTSVATTTPLTKFYNQFLQSLQSELKRESCDSEDKSCDPLVLSMSEQLTPPSSSARKTLEEELLHHNALMRHFCSFLKIRDSSVAPYRYTVFHSQWNL